MTEKNENQQPGPDPSGLSTAAAPIEKQEAAKTSSVFSIEDLIPDEPTEPEFDLSGKMILLYGLPKIGKSSLANQFPGAIFVPTEPGLSHIRHFQIPPNGFCATWGDLGKACKALATDKARSRFKTVVIDTVDNAWLSCERFICQREGIKTIQEQGYGVGAGKVLAEFRNAMQQFVQLGYGLIFTSHAEIKEFDDPHHGRFSRIVPTLPERARKMVAGLVDHILYFGLDQVSVPDGDGVRMVDCRVIRCRPSRGWDAGGRIELPADIVAIGGAAETYRAIVDAHAKAVEVAAKQDKKNLSGAVPVGLEGRAKFGGSSGSKK